MEKQQLIDQFDKNSMEVIKVHIQEWKGSTYVDMRVWIKPDDGENGGEIATKKGLTLHVELIPDLIAALEKARESIQISPSEATGETSS